MTQVAALLEDLGLVFITAGTAPDAQEAEFALGVEPNVQRHFKVVLFFFFLAVLRGLGVVVALARLCGRGAGLGGSLLPSRSRSAKPRSHAGHSGAVLAVAVFAGGAPPGVELAVVGEVSLGVGEGSLLGCPKRPLELEAKRHIEALYDEFTD